jgi:hypothetical protein
MVDVKIEAALVPQSKAAPIISQRMRVPGESLHIPLSSNH